MIVMVFFFFLVSLVIIRVAFMLPFRLYMHSDYRSDFLHLENAISLSIIELYTNKEIDLQVSLKVREGVTGRPGHNAKFCCGLSVFSLSPLL